MHGFVDSIVVLFRHQSAAVPAIWMLDVDPLDSNGPSPSPFCNLRVWYFLLFSPMHSKYFMSSFRASGYIQHLEQR